MDIIKLILILLTTLVYFSYCLSPCKEYYATSHKRCKGWWGWWGCKIHYSSASKCCDGYEDAWFMPCSRPLCRRGYGPHTCDIIDEGYVKYKDGTVVRDSGGECYKPSKCRNCNKGFYPVTLLDGYCKECPRPPYCNLPVCTSSSDVICEYCVGEYIREKVGYNIYTGKPDNTKCQKACSWVDGARCFPGSCSGDMVYANDCKCSTGWLKGADCKTASNAELPTIKDMHVTLKRSNNPPLVVDKALRETSFWTKETDWSQLSLTASSHYKPDIDKATKPNYINNYYIGIESLQISMTLTRGSDRSDWEIDGGCTNFKENCDKSLNKPLSTIAEWKKIYKGYFEHGDRINFTVSAKNGGRVYYAYRSSTSQPYSEKSYFLNGIVESETLEIGFDVYPPIHCFENDNNCLQDALKTTDFLTEPKLTVHWHGWKDDDSGIGEYELNVYVLHATSIGSPLTNKELSLVRKTTALQSSITLELKEPGPYSVEMIVYDRARNVKVARRIILFDNASIVDLAGDRVKVLQAQSNGWINELSDKIEIVWPKRFRNNRHSNGGWLNEVAEIKEVRRELDDRVGRSSRTIEKIDNIEGIVRFEVAFSMDLNNHSSYNDFKRVPDEYFHLEKMIYDNVEFIDGKKMTYFIRGVDAVGKFAEDNVTVMIDLSPPVIQNLWLTKGDLVNISVHSVLALKDLTIEWQAFDYHSGIHEVSWRIFDNFTKNIVTHGLSYEPPQGDTKTVNECKKKYGSYPRGANCYCSPYNGCFHKHYQIKPLISNESNGGLNVGKEKGVHDYDYYIEVSVTNIAGLKTIKHKKITIDTSPPHEGIVHDGIPENPEVDFQQSLKLEGHWDGFFDRESSVWFYVYGYSGRCLNEDDLDKQMPRTLKVNWTYDSRVEFTAPSSGKYHLTVMAYNHALGHSQPVCSDGVTVDNEPAVVSEVVIQDAVMASGLVKSDVHDTVYILHRNRELMEVKEPTAICRNRATLVSDSILNLYPHKRDSNGSMSVVVLNDKCNNFYGVHSDLISYITSDSKVDISWNVTFGAGSVHDFEVGISSENTTSPNVMNFVSSHHHQHIRLFHPDIFDGEQFYVMIKAITKSSVSDIKVVGPLVYDSSKPDFMGDINLSVEQTKIDDLIIARWDKDSFTDHGDPNALRYEAAIGL